MDADQVIDDIRSCLISSKGGVPISQINRDYKMIVGHSIPYNKLGYTNLENFLKAIPGLNVYPKGGDLVLEALPTKNTFHITAMVRGQKSSAPRRRTAPSNYGIRNLKGFRTPFTVPQRKVMPVPMEKVKRPAPQHLTSMPRPNLPPRFKALAANPPLQTPVSTLARLPDATPSTIGPRKVQEVSFNFDSVSLYQTESRMSSDQHPLGPRGDLRVADSPDPLASGSSVLRTPTGVLGRKSPSVMPEYRRHTSEETGVLRTKSPSVMQDYRRHTSEELSPSPLMSIHFPSLVAPRTSAQARISRQVSLPPISLDTDVKMSPVSPTYAYGAEAKQLPSSSSVAGESKSSVYCKTLQIYCMAKHLPEPVYKIIPSFPKSKTKQIVCSIKVGPDHQFSSYPAECKTEEEAREVAAQDAVESLERIYGVLGESLPITVDENVLVDRIAQMVHDHPNGLWSLQLPADYRNLFREILPDGWLDVVRTSPLIMIDRAVHDRIILLPNRASSSSSSVERVTPTSPSPVDLTLSGLTMTDKQEWKVEPELGEYTVANGEAADFKGYATTADFEGYAPTVDVRGHATTADLKDYATTADLKEQVASLSQIKLPEEEYWNVYVSYGTSPSNVWFRLIGEEYSVLYDDMAAEMEIFYMDGGTMAESLIPGYYYAIQVDECWHRVELVELLEDEESDVKGPRFASCFFVDNGDDDTVEVLKFRILDSKFTQLPCQAVQCRLNGLEDFGSDAAMVERIFLEKIIGHNFVAKPAPGSLEDEADGRSYPSVTLYDTSSDENVNMNEELLENIIIATVPPSLLKNGKIQEAFVSYISKSGAFFIQIPSNIFDFIAKAIDEFSLNIADHGDYTSGKIAAGVTAVFEDMMYLAKFHEDSLWYRAVKDPHKSRTEDGKVWVKFVDYGNSELTSLRDMVLLPPSHPLGRLPPQAMECRLHNMPSDLQFTDSGLKRCREIVSPEEPVLLKVTSSSADSTEIIYDVVEIFKRVQPDNLLASVSTTLSVEDGAFENVSVGTGEDEDSRALSPKSPTKEPMRPIMEPMRPTKEPMRPTMEPMRPTKEPMRPTKEPMRPIKLPCLPSEPDMPRILPAPRVPCVGELFDVHVTIAANPGNFTVQPWKDAYRFNDLMSDIQSVYSASSTDLCAMTPAEAAIYREPLERSQVREGGVYVALHDDQLWYRISISKLIEGPSPEEVMVSAYFVDYGDVAVMTLDKLRELAPEFYSVPYQAIKAKLAGVLPVHSDWSVEDCLRFQEMVCNKEFVSKIVETGPDLIDPSETVIGLHLTDTSDPKVDASIGQIFIDEGRAIVC